jgi:hypothetical protein
MQMLLHVDGSTFSQLLIKPMSPNLVDQRQDGAGRSASEPQLAYSIN